LETKFGISFLSRFRGRRITIAKRVRAKLREIKIELKRRRHQPVPEQGYHPPA
jgi:hypothetical protein